jgi:hypothetical protein
LRPSSRAPGEFDQRLQFLPQRQRRFEIAGGDSGQKQDRQRAARRRRAGKARIEQAVQPDRWAAALVRRKGAVAGGVLIERDAFAPEQRPQRGKGPLPLPLGIGPQQGDGRLALAVVSQGVEGAGEALGQGAHPAFFACMVGCLARAASLRARV